MLNKIYLLAVFLIVFVKAATGDTIAPYYSSDTFTNKVYLSKMYRSSPGISKDPQCAYHPCDNVVNVNDSLTDTVTISFKNKDNNGSVYRITDKQTYLYSLDSKLIGICKTNSYIVQKNNTSIQLDSGITDINNLQLYCVTWNDFPYFSFQISMKPIIGAPNNTYLVQFDSITVFNKQYHLQSIVSFNSMYGTEIKTIYLENVGEIYFELTKGSLGRSSEIVDYYRKLTSLNTSTNGKIFIDSVFVALRSKGMTDISNKVTSSKVVSQKSIDYSKMFNLLGQQSPALKTTYLHVNSLWLQFRYKNIRCK
jgi:hypothetical protein